MILNTDKPEVIHSETPIRRIDMSIMDAESIAVMLEYSRDGFYSNKELAPIREYATNARDAHIEAGIPERPIEITLPNQLNPELRIRDFGKGLTINQLEDVYFRYWKSTKRGSNAVNGCLGIGAKSAFAYAPAYTVITWCGGMKTVGTGQKNGFADIIYHQPNTNGESDGVEIVIPVEQKDIYKFIHEATKFFKYWDIRPIFHNVEQNTFEQNTLKEAFNIMDTPPFISGDGWAVRPAGYGHGESKAIMGFVAYDIDWEQVKNSLAPEIALKINGIFDFLRENITSLYFPLGSLSFTPNRESLQYNELTIKVLSEKLQQIYGSLLNLITSKISNAPSIWEAKIRYNKIFNKELDGFEKTEIYGGNLSTLENILKNRVVWNGIVITNGYFEGVGDWDETTGKVERCHHLEGFESIFETYVKDEQRIGIKLSVKDEERIGIKLSSSGRKRRRYRYGYGNKIICSPRSMVIVQDTDSPSSAKALAHWFLYKANKEFQQIYILNLTNAGVKTDFFKYYNFDTVPVSYVSQNMLLIKAYQKSIRAPHGSNTAAAELRESRPIYCPYIVIENRRKNNYIRSLTWNYENVNVRGISGGGYYVVYSKNSFTFNGREIEHDNSYIFWQSIYDLALIAGVDVPEKVYGIHPRTAESEWFKEAIEDGSWTSIDSWVKDNENALPKEIIKKVLAFNDICDGRVGIPIASQIASHLINNDGVAGKYFKEIADFPKYWNMKNIPTCLRLDSTYLPDEIIRETFIKMNDEMKAKYPLLFKVGDDSRISQNNPADSYHKITDETAKELGDYINIIDCYGV